MAVLLKLLLLVVAAQIIPSVEGYANWLKCYVDLDDTEIVMNKKMLTHEDAEHVVDLQVKRVSNNDDSQKESNNQNWQTANVVYPAQTKSTWKVKVKPPPELEGQNMQFVVEAEAIYNSGSSSTDKSAIMFTFPKMCEGRRSFGRNYNEAVTIEIDGTPDSVELWGAWAIGYGQVSLTPRFVMMLGKEEDEEL